MNLLASALLKQTIVLKDFDTWSNIRKHYLPLQYHKVYQIIQKHIQSNFCLPTFQELTLQVRQQKTLGKIHAIMQVQVQTEPFLLLQYIKNQFTQQQALTKIKTFIQQSIAFQDAKQTIQSIYDIASHLQQRVQIGKVSQSMQRIQLFDTDQQIQGYMPLGLNTQYDKTVRFRNTDYLMIGGKRGQGKSLTCSNIAHRVHQTGKSVLYFSIEMPPRQILQRQASIATQIPISKLKYKTMDNLQWERMAQWWCSRFQQGDQVFQQVYMKNRDFAQMHKVLTSNNLKQARIQIIYQPNLTLPKFRSQAVRLCQKLQNVGLVVLDYLNQVKKTQLTQQKFKWQDQIDISTAIKNSALNLQVPHISPYQVDSSGQARFAKGILDPADYAFYLNKSQDALQFISTKARNQGQRGFTSTFNPSTLTIGPQSATIQKVQQQSKDPKGTKFTNQDQVFQL